MSEAQTEVTVDAIEVRIDQLKDMVKESDALERLMSNADFKTVILDGYFRETAIRLVEFKASPNAQGEAQQAATLAQIDAIGELQQHLNAVRAMGDNARAAIADGYAEIDELNAEENS